MTLSYFKKQIIILLDWIITLNTLPQKDYIARLFHMNHILGTDKSIPSDTKKLILFDQIISLLNIADNPYSKSLKFLDKQIKKYNELASPITRDLTDLTISTDLSSWFTELKT